MKYVNELPITCHASSSKCCLELLPYDDKQIQRKGSDTLRRQSFAAIELYTAKLKRINRKLQKSTSGWNNYILQFCKYHKIALFLY